MSYALGCLGLAALLGGLGVLAAMVVGYVLDGPVLRSSSASTSAMALAPSQPLIVGRMPGPDDVLLLALLRGGVRAVAETLLVGALSAGWLRHQGTSYSILHDVEARDRGQAVFQRHAADPLLSLGQAMHRSALELEPGLLLRAEGGGLWRPTDRRLLLRAIGTGGALTAVLLSLAWMRVMTTEALAAFALVAFVVVAVSHELTKALTARHRQAHAMLTWLDEVCGSLRDDVQNGRERDPHRVSLVAALDGLEGTHWVGTALNVRLESHDAGSLRAQN